MDIIAIIQNSFAGMNIWQIVAGIFAGAVIMKLIDEVILQLLGKFWPEKYLEKVYDAVQKFDDNYIDKLKEKYPKAAKELENRIINFLTKIEDIILDK